MVHGGIAAREEKVNVVPVVTSFTVIGKTVDAGAVTVTPEAVHVGAVTPGHIKEQTPPKHPLQFKEVVVLAHV